MNKLRINDSIGVFSPSFPITYLAPKRFERSKIFLKNKGFNIIEGVLTGKYDFYRSGTIKERANELNSLIRNPKVKCIISTIGGSNSNSILPYIDYEAFIKNPKIIIGYSDVTAILLAIYKKTGISTYYGPALVASFGEFPPFVEKTFENFKAILIDNLDFPFQYKKSDIWTEEFIDWEIQDREKIALPNNWITINEGNVTGRLIAGNLNTILGIWGSEYMPEIKKDDILLIEDSLKDIATVEKNFSFLKINGVFDKIGGLILGKHELFKDLGTEKKHYQVLEEIIGKTKIPILSEFDCCHTHPMFTMPIGSTIELDATKQTIKLLKI